jgi:hypothetical protein
LGMWIWSSEAGLEPELKIRVPESFLEWQD